MKKKRIPTKLGVYSHILASVYLPSNVCHQMSLTYPCGIQHQISAQGGKSVDSPIEVFVSCVRVEILRLTREISMPLSHPRTFPHAPDFRT